MFDTAKATEGCGEESPEADIPPARRDGVGAV